MKPAPPSASYVEHVAKLEQRLSTDAALRRAVGGEFLAVGKLEYHLLRSRGLSDDHRVVDVGCGSGRLACQLAPFPGIRYLGTDVVPRLLSYAEELCARPDWRFVPTDGVTIPCGDAEADFVCFFSVFTHLPQEDIYRYFREAHRVLKPGGLLVMSFLEFRVPAHWAAFIHSVDGKREDHHLNQFVERDAIHAWATPAGFTVRSIHGGDTNYIPLPEDVCFENGTRASDAASLGQSLAVLQKREAFAGYGAGPAVADDPATTSPETSAVRPVMQGLPVKAPTAPLLNVSARACLQAGGSVTAGFLIGGTSHHRVVVRAVGPTLTLFGVPSPLSQPTLAVFAGELPHGRNAGGWGGNAELSAIMTSVGAFPLPPESKDAVLALTLPPGSYTAVVQGATADDQGDVVVEVYLID